MPKKNEDPSKYIWEPAPGGVVVDENGARAPGARVLLYRYEGPRGSENGIVEETVSGHDGRFVLEREIRVRKFHGSAGRADQMLFAMLPGRAPGWAVPDREGKAVTLRLTKPVSQTFEVVDLAGNPVRGATVWLRYAGTQMDKQPIFRESFQLAEDIGLCHATTDERGRATLDTLPDTTYSVAASMQGYEDETSCETPREGIPRFILKPGGVLEGRVTDPLGQPVPGALVWLFPKFRYFLFFTARTDADGRYKVEKIWCNNEGHPDWGRYEVGILDSRFAAATREVAFTSGQRIAGFDFRVEPGAEIDGHLYDPATREPVAGASVQMDSASGRQYMTTGAQGEFTCRVAPGRIRPFFLSPPPGTYVTEEDRRGPPGSLQTEARGERCTVDLYLPSRLGRLGMVRGRVQTAEGNPVGCCQISPVIGGGRVMLNHWRGNTLKPLSSNEDGAFELPGIPIGPAFTLMAKSADGLWAGTLAGKLSSDIEELSAPLIVGPTRQVEVFIVDRAGNARPNFAVTVAPLVSGDHVWLERLELKTEGDGVLTIPNVMPGSRYLIAQTGADYSRAILDTGAGAAQRTLMVSDEFTVRLLGADGTPMPIRSIRNFEAHTTIRGRKTRWTNGPPDILRHEGSDAIVSRKTLGRCEPGDQIDFAIETEGGRVVKASGKMPESGTALVVAYVSEPPAEEMTPDPTISAAPEELVVRVVDPAGKPVAGATVDFGGGLPRRDLPPVVTDEQGIFRLPDMAGRFFACATIEAKGCAPIFLTPEIPLGKAWKVALQNTTRLRGVIGGSDPGTVALLLETDKEHPGGGLHRQTRGIQYRTETDEHGGYDFPIEPGCYRFTATSTDGRFAQGEVTVARGAVAALPAELRPGTAVTLQLVDCQSGEPVPGVEIVIFERQGPGVLANRLGSNRTTDARGIARWENLPPGKTNFSALGRAFSKRAACPWSRWWLADEPEDARAAFEPGRINYAVRPPTGRDGVGSLYIDVKDAMPAVRIFVERGVRISGRVVGAAGEPLAGIRVGVVAHAHQISSLTGDSRFTAITGEDGGFLEYIPAGNGIRYSLSAFTWGQQPATLANAVSETFASQPGDELNFDLRMGKGGWISGRVVGPDAKELARVKVTAEAQDHLDSSYGARIAPVDAEGRFRLGPLRAGHYVIRAGVGEGAPLSRLAGSEPKDAGDLADGEEREIGEIMVPAGLQTGR